MEEYFGNIPIRTVNEYLKYYSAEINRIMSDRTEIIVNAKAVVSYVCCCCIGYSRYIGSGYRLVWDNLLLITIKIFFYKCKSYHKGNFMLIFFT